MEGGRTGEGRTRLVRPWMSCLLASLPEHGEVRTVYQKTGAPGFPHGRGGEAMSSQKT